MAPRIAFDGRYINDRYHGIGRVAFSLLEALVRADSDYEFVVYVHPGYRNTRFSLRRLAQHRRVELRWVRLPVLVPIEQLGRPLLLPPPGVHLVHPPYVRGPV